MSKSLPLSHKRPLPLDTFYYGSTYYPEHWQPEDMAEDVARMQAAGFNMVRMAEFAWHLFEPEEGVYDFSWLDPHIEKLGQAGIFTMMCTPTATPPRWLTYKHPEMMREAVDGGRMCHGSRQHASHFSEVFREYSRKITKVLAEHYAGNPYVAGWQTDNEFHCHFAEDHQPDAQTAFREFLSLKFDGDIEKLNRAWGTDFWAMTYQDFHQVETPREGHPTHLNPAHVLDYQRFLSWGVTRFQKEQVDILRQANPDWWITHNGCFASIDFHGPFTRDLDFLGFDCYPFFDQNIPGRWLSHAFNLDYVRGFSGNFIIPEQQSGPGGQTHYIHNTPEPGEMRRMAYSSIARGADSLLFFRWRTCRFGAEEYWCGLLDHDNLPKRRLAEAGQLGAELKVVGPALMGSSVKISVAVAGADYDAQAAHLALHLGVPAPRQASEPVHMYFNARGHAVGIVHPEDDLSGVDLYVIPHLPLFKAEWVPGLKSWVEQGGTLIVGVRAGCKDENNNVIADPLPGCLRELTGTRVQEVGKQNEPNTRPLEIRRDEQSVLTEMWYEELVAEDAEVLATWDSRFLKGQPAITCRNLGAGRVLHVGTWLTDEVLDLLSDFFPAALGFPEKVEVVDRVHPEGYTLRFLINHRKETVDLNLTQDAEDLISGSPVSGSVSLEPNGVMVLKIK